MQTQTVAQAVDQTLFDKRTKRVLCLMPGVMFGMPPENCSELLERIDCPICSQLLDVLELQHRLELQQRKIKKDARKPMQDKYERRKRLWLIGRFFTEPVDPDIQFMPEYASTHAALETQIGELDRDVRCLRDRCSTHWEGTNACKLSFELVRRLFAKDHSLISQ